MNNFENLDQEIKDFLKKLYLPENAELLQQLANDLRIPVKYINPCPDLKKALEQE